MRSNYFSLFDDFNNTPSLVLGQRAGFHNFNLVADAALVVFVMCL